MNEKLLEKELEQEFIKDFGKNAYEKLKESCRYHIESGHIDREYRGNFMQVILITLGFQCVEVEEHRKFHEIPFEWKTFREWLLRHKDEIANCKVSDNDIDFLALFSGAYDFLFDERARGENQ